MNEVLAVIYFTLKMQDIPNDPLFGEKYIESDTFFCFVNIMMELKDGFIRELDNEKNGI